MNFTSISNHFNRSKNRSKKTMHFIYIQTYINIYVYKEYLLGEKEIF